MDLFTESTQTPLSRKDLLKRASAATATVAASGTLLTGFRPAAQPAPRRPRSSVH